MERCDIMMVNRSGESELLRNNILFVIVVVLFFVGSLYWVNSYKDHAAFWEDFYAKEIVRQIDLADSGSILELDVTKAISIAERAGKDPLLLFSIDNNLNVVTVSLRQGGGRSFTFFSNVTVVNDNIQFLNGGTGSPVNHLRLRIL